MYVPGDKYRVFYSTGGGTLNGQVHDRWEDAKNERNTIFYSSLDVRAVWIMKDNPSLGSAPQHYGYTMRRRRYEARQCTAS